MVLLVYLALGNVLFGPPALIEVIGRGWRQETGKAVDVLTGLASMLAGARHAHLREAWAADLYGDPESGETPAGSKKLRMAAGFIAAALRCRLDDAADLLWQPVDALVSSWHGSNLAVLLPLTITVGLILPREGFYGLIANADNLAVIAGASYAAIKGLRKYRQIETPKRPERKTTKNASSSAESTRPRE
jgi:hypothetical protein